MPKRTVRINLTAKESQIHAINRLAKQAGITRSAYMVQAREGQVWGRVETGWAADPP
jgi:uncharacterized protein (DUF1778 family)